MLRSQVLGEHRSSPSSGHVQNEVALLLLSMLLPALRSQPVPPADSLSDSGLCKLHHLDPDSKSYLYQVTKGETFPPGGIFP